MNENEVIEKINRFFGNDLGNKLIKFANQLSKIAELEKEVEKLKKRLDKANI